MTNFMHLKIGIITISLLAAALAWTPFVDAAPGKPSASKDISDLNGDSVVDLDDLVDASEIARRLGVKRPQVVHDWRRRHDDFPEPVAHLGNGHIWLWPEVKRWARSTGRLG